MKQHSIQFAKHIKRWPGICNRSPRWKTAIVCVLGMFAYLASTVYGHGQQPAPKLTQKSPIPYTGTWPTTRFKSSPVPVSHVYAQFLLLQVHLDERAGELEAQGKDGSDLRTAFQKRIALTDPEMATIRAAGLRLRSRMDEIYKQAWTIAQADRAARAQNPNSSTVVPNPALLDLNTQRENAIQQEIDTLNQQLGSASASKLLDFLQHRWLESQEFAARLQPHSSHTYPQFTGQSPKPQEVQK